MRRIFALLLPSLLSRPRVLLRILPALLLGAWAVAIAQSPTGEEGADRADTGEPAVPCVSAGNAILPAGIHGPPEPGAVPCEDQEPVPDEDQQTGEDVTADEVFEASDEILEDYPIPLPSDM